MFRTVCDDAPTMVPCGTTTAAGDDYSTPEVNPGVYGNIMATMGNLFVKYSLAGFGAVELFGTYEQVKGGNKAGDTGTVRTWNHIMADLILRFGEGEKFYVAGRYNQASGQLSDTNLTKVTVNKIAAAAGWFMTNNVMIKLEYTTQEYKDFPTTGTKQDKFIGAKMQGFVLESSISF